MTARNRPIDLSRAGNGSFSPGKPAWFIGLWMLVEWLLVSNPLNISSRLRVAVLRLFGAEIGEGVRMVQAVRVKFPWRLRIGDRSWIGERVWLHNQAQLTIGADTVVSQDSFITTGGHDTVATMDLRVAPVTIGAGVWITSRCIVQQGVTIGDNAIVLPGGVVTRSLDAQGVYGGVPAVFVKRREMTTPEL
jgi:putative colanic acid biosynthesis acetyltransferase WcaF